MTNHIRRREFVTLLGGAAAAWPLAARAQQRGKVPVVGYLFPGLPELTESLTAAFRKGLSESGFVEGRNVSIEYRFARNDFDRLPELAADLVRREVGVIATAGGVNGAKAARAATTTIPIVFEVGADPVEEGLVASLNRPGGNLTGVTALNLELDAKRLGLLCELVPGAARIGVLVNPSNSVADKRIKNLQVAAASIGRHIEVFPASTTGEIDAAFVKLAQKPVDALVVAPGPLFYGFRAQLAAALARVAIPAIYSDAPLVEAGGLMSYGTNGEEPFFLVGAYTGRILKGEKPADLPVQQPTRFEFIINLQTAQGTRHRSAAQAAWLADEVIE